MNTKSEIERLRAELAALERKSRRSSWIFRQAGKKIIRFPVDLPRRLARSIRKRIRSSAPPRSVSRPRSSVPKSSGPIVLATNSWAPFLSRLKPGAGPAAEALAQMRSFQTSDAFRAILDDAIALDPNIASVDVSAKGHLPPWFDDPYLAFCEAADLLPQGKVDSVILVPFGKMGGADYVAGLLSRVLAKSGRTVILRTDLPDWDRPDWYAEDATTVDLSDALSGIPDRQRALYCLLQILSPKAVYNVNSRLCFDMFEQFGRQLSGQFDLHAYYFCADHTEDGHEAGYPVWYVSGVLPYLKAALCDTAYLRDRLIERYNVPSAEAVKLRAIYTPFAEPPPDVPLVSAQIASRTERDRPAILWAGRLDRQKRFDLVQEIAAQMPHVDFHAWGKAVLDAPPKLNRLPPNLTLNAPFARYSELPLIRCDGWLYTAAWDGLPTILIEIAGMAMPIVASAVGGVPELVDETTGWPVREADDVQAYVRALEDMLSDPDRRARRALAAQARVRERHSFAAYECALAAGAVT